MHRLRSFVSTAAGVVIVAFATAPVAAQGDKGASAFRESYAAEARREYATALAKVREARAGGANSYFAALRSGWLSYLLVDFPASIASYAEAVAAEPKAIEPKLGLTLPLLGQRNWRELERACQAVLAVDSHNATALARLGVAQYGAGNFAGAETTYRRLADDYPSELDYKTGLGWALLKQGKGAEAKALFDGVLAVSPDNVSARAGIGAR